VPPSARLPLAAVTLLVLLSGLVAWLVGERRPGPGSAETDSAPIVTIAPETSSPPEQGPPAASSLVLPPPPATGPPFAGQGAREPRRRLPEVESYALESGPFPSPEATDRVEDEINRLGYSTIRFRKQDAPRVHLVTLTGFPTLDEARRVATDLGRGVAVENSGEPEVLLDQLPSLTDAITAARLLQTQGYEVRVTEAVSPPLYHLRYGRFGNRGQAEALRDELSASGIKSRVVRLR
jgi:hypothetical protein